METEQLEAAAKAAKDARRAMQLTLFAVLVAIVVLAIDHTIKRAIIAEAQQVRDIFATFQEATRGLKQAADESRADDSAPNGVADTGSGGVADGARARTAPGRDAGTGRFTPAGGKSGAEPRP